jgi:hypothetical protein
MEIPMTQALLSFDTLPADPLDRVGFDIGWDHARHRITPPLRHSSTRVAAQSAAISGTSVCR